MIRLVRMEILRLWSRRLFKIASAGVLLLITVIVVVDGAHHTKHNAAAYEKFRNERLARYDNAVAGMSAEQRQGFPSRADVERNPESFCFSEGGQQDQPVENPCGGAPEPPYITSTALSDFGKAVAVICAFAAFLIGASAAGAEWSAGTMQSLLYWEPRRVRVVLGKIVGLVTIITLLVVVAEALFTGLAFAAGSLRGTTSGVTGGLFASYLLLVGRAVLFAGFAAVLGFSVAFATRVTAAAVGIAFVYFAILENLLIVWKVWLAKFTIGRLLASWLNNGIRDEGPNGKPVIFTGVRAGVTLATYAILMLVAATVWFRQRDVT
jgi:ABC-type transport system involved in multi-copper enzyme maturation permease subunit